MVPEVKVAAGTQGRTAPLLSYPSMSHSLFPNTADSQPSGGSNLSTVEPNRNPCHTKAAAVAVVPRGPMSSSGSCLDEKRQVFKGQKDPGGGTRDTMLLVTRPLQVSCCEHRSCVQVGTVPAEEKQNGLLVH